MQLVDELSMIYTTSITFYAVFSFHKPRRYRVLLGACLALLCVFITLYYHYLQDPRFHQNAYALLVATVLLRSMWIMEAQLRPKYRATEAGLARGRSREEKRRDERDVWILSQMWWMLALGIGLTLAALGIWALDNTFCPTLRRWRRQVGLPWGTLLEGHGWWYGCRTASSTLRAHR